MLPAKSAVRTARPAVPWDVAARVSTLFSADPIPIELCVAGVAVADRLRRAGSLTRAEAIYRQALEGLERNGQSHFAAARAHRGLATILAARDQLDRAAARFEQAIDALDVCRTTHRGVLPHIVKNVRSIAELLRTQGKLDLAERLLRECIGAVRQSRSSSQEELAAVLCDTARVMRNLGRLYEAVELLLEALQIHVRVLGDDHPTTRGTRRTLVMLQRQVARQGWMSGHLEEIG